MRLQALLDILEMLVEFEETGDFDAAWETIIRDTVTLTGATRGAIFLVDRELDLLVPRVWFGRPWHGEGRPRPYPRDEGIAGRVWASGQSLAVDDVRVAESFRASHSPHKGELRSLLCVPIRAREHVIGVIAVDSTETAAFGPEEERLLTTLARHVAQAWEQAKLFHGMRALGEVGARLNNVGPRGHYRALLQEIAERALEVVAAGATNRGEATAVLYRYDAEQGRFDDLYRVGARARSGGVEIPIDRPRPDGLGERAVSHRRRLLSYEEPDLTIRPMMQADGVVSVVCYPLIAGGRVLGVLYVSLRDPRPFSRQELLLLDNFVNQAALAVYQIEEATQAERALAVSETFAAVGDIAANLMHRLNNQVGTIPVRVQGIQAKSSAVESDPYLARNLTAIEQAARAAMNNVREIVHHLHPIELDAVSVAEALEGALTEAALPDGVQVQVEGLTALPPVRAGAPQLRLIFLNLLENAAEAMNGLGTVTLRGGSGRHTVWIEIQDSGPGIPAPLLDRIFELNVSGGNERKLGFGLWWVRSNLNRCGGDIAVVSGPDQPATFHLTLRRFEP